MPTHYPVAMDVKVPKTSRATRNVRKLANVAQALHANKEDLRKTAEYEGKSDTHVGKKEKEKSRAKLMKLSARECTG